MSSRMAGAAVLRHLGPRLFAAEPLTVPAAARILPARMSSTAAAPEQRQKPEAPAPEGQDKIKAVVSYWGIQPRKLVKEDGTEWRWFCFRVSTFATAQFQFVMVAV